MLDKSIAARISAYWNSWDEEAFAQQAERGLIFRQEFHISIVFGYVISKDDREFPVRQLIDIKSIPYLNIVLPIDAINLRILSLLSFIEGTRKLSLEYSSNSYKGIFVIDIIGGVGENRDGEIYGLVSFESLNELEEKIREQQITVLDNTIKRNPAADFLKYSDTEFKFSISMLISKYFT